MGGSGGVKKGINGKRRGDFVDRTGGEVKYRSDK